MKEFHIKNLFLSDAPRQTFQNLSAPLVRLIIPDDIFGDGKEISLSWMLWVSSLQPALLQTVSELQVVSVLHG